jgi:hypothetical protein
MKKNLILLILFVQVAYPFSSALSQSYSFEVPKAIVDVFWNSDGTLSLAYEWLFRNDLGAAPIDFVDVGLPSGSYDLGSIRADVNGIEIGDIQNSPYVKPGIALGLGANAIQPGEEGRVRVYIPAVRKDLFLDETEAGYASAAFAPTWFDSQFVRGDTDMTVVFHLPPGVQTEEPRWHSAPSGFNSEPESALDDENRIVYIWRNPQARITDQYTFGASFPSQYVAAESIVQPGASGVDASTSGEMTALEGLFGGLFACISGLFSSLPSLLCFGVIGWLIFGAARSGSRRKLQYLPPKISIEGHGIKRGLTAVEAAILMEQPMDKIMTMILFGAIKKNAASVKSREPLELEISVPQPEGLHPYEVDFLHAFALEKTERRKKLQEAMIALVNSVAEKMKGFSRKETVDYYKSIIEKAWGQVEAAGTPEVKSEKYDEVMEWTMLDRDYDDRTRRAFGSGPVFVPMWWPRYDPTFPRPAAGGAPSLPSQGMGAPGGGKQVSLPSLPGSDFAASVVNGVQTFSAGVVGNLTSFTDGVTNKTNPIPASTTSSWRGSGSGGGGTHCVCACACACAGCACACAGGGR